VPGFLLFACCPYNRRSMATVVFADLVGSTGIFERLGDETAGRFVTQLTTALSKTFEEHNGRVVKLRFCMSTHLVALAFFRL